MTNLHKLADKYRVILGSSSPRRYSLLEETGIAFSCNHPNIVEHQRDDEEAYQFALRLAREKAESLKTALVKDQLVIGCDTIVVLGNKVLGKPENEKHALEILSELSGKSHVVCTALAIADCHELLVSDYDLTTVFFKKVTEEQLLEYIATKEPMDKAGAYGIQGMGSFLVDRIEGNLDNVIGLPRLLLDEMAADLLNR